MEHDARFDKKGEDQFNKNQFLKFFQHSGITFGRKHLSNRFFIEGQHVTYRFSAEREHDLLSDIFIPFMITKINKLHSILSKLGVICSTGYDKIVLSVVNNSAYRI